jgi:hypothetical protein
MQSSVSAPTVDYIARHTINVPRADSGAYANIEDYGAVKETTGTMRAYITAGAWDDPTKREFTNVDCASAIQAAIDAAEVAGHNTVFVPRGIYYIGSTVNLKPHTKFIGTGPNFSLIATHGDWQPTSFTYMFTTPDDANATCHWSEVGMVTKCIAGSFTQPIGPYEHDHFSYVHWRSGKNSSSIMNLTGRQWMFPDYLCHPKHYYSFSGNAGGKHYGGFDNQGDRFGNPACRAIMVQGTSQPLHLYGCNREVTKVSSGKAGANLEINNAANIRVYNCKREGDSPSTLIVSSTNVALYGHGRQEVDSTSPYQHKITGASDKILIGISTLDLSDYAPTTKGNPIEEIDGQSTYKINWPEGCSLYKRGEIDDSLVEID